MLDLQLKDNVKRRKLDKQRNRYVKRPDGAPMVESHKGMYAFYGAQVNGRGNG